MSEHNWIELAEQALELPYGRARSTMLEKALQLAARDDADEEDLFWLRMDLTGSYQHGGEPAHAFTTFARCLSAFDADPARYGPNADHKLLWQFKWIVSSLTDFPEVPLDRTRAVLDDMERRYREGGHSLHAVYGLRCLMARHLGDTAAADAAFDLWRTAARDETSDCEGCVPSDMVTHLVWRGACEEAVTVAEPVLSGQLSCVEQPQRILTTLMEPYLRTGRHDAAVDAHRRAYRVHRRQERHHLAQFGEHLFFCALTGNHARGLQILERHLGALDEPPSPMDAMEFAASAALLLDRLAAAGHGDLSVRRPAHGDRPVAEVGVTELRDQLRAHAYDIAARFDTRNGTTAQTDRVRAHLAAEPVVDTLPLTEYAPRPRPAVATAPPPSAEPFAEDWADLLQQADRWWSGRQQDRARAALRRFDALTGEIELPAWARGRRAETEGRVRESDGDLAKAVEHYRAAADHYADAEHETDRQRTLGRLGAVLARSGAPEGLPLLEEATAYLDAHGGADDRVATRARLASCLAERGEFERARTLLEEADLDAAEPGLRATALTLLAAVLSGQEHTHEKQDAVLDRARRAARESGIAGLVADVAYRHACLLRALDGASPETAWQALDEAAAQSASAAPDMLGAVIALTRGHWLCDEREYARAAAPLAEAVAQATALGEEPLAARARVLLARAYQGGGRHFEAAEVAEEALAVEEAVQLDVSDRMVLREVLARALTELGDLDDAVLRWEELLALHDPEQEPDLAAYLHIDAARLLDRLDRDAEAAEHYGAAAAVWEKLEEPYLVSMALRYQAMALRWSGDGEAALEASRRAERWLDRAAADTALPSRMESHRRGAIRYDRARILWATATAAEAAAEAEAAVALLAESADDSVVDQARHLLDAIRENAD